MAECTSEKIQEPEPPESIDSEILKLEEEIAVSSSIIFDIKTNSKKLARDFSGLLLRLAEDLKGSFSKWIRIRPPLQERIQNDNRSVGS